MSTTNTQTGLNGPTIFSLMEPSGGKAMVWGGCNVIITKPIISKLKLSDCHSVKRVLKGKFPSITSKYSWGRSFWREYSSLVAVVHVEVHGSRKFIL